MPQIINTNIASLNAQRNLNKSQSANQTALQRLSSGLRINSAKDDAAGLAISTRFNSQIRGLNVAVRNAGDGISLAQTAEGALGSMNDNLQRIRELAVQSANATNSDIDRDALQAEVGQLLSEVSRTAEETDFNGRKLLDGSFSATFQIGANAGQTLDVSIAELTADKLGAAKSAGLSATGNDNALSNGDLTINGIAIDASKAGDDTASTNNSAASAIAKVEAINAKYDQTGVKAQVNDNVVSGSEMTGAATTGTLTLNGVDISISTTTSTNQTRAGVVEAINSVSSQTGVTAINSDSDAGGVQLVAEDGRNIQLAFANTLSSSATGLATAGTYEGGYTLVADSDVPEIVIQGGNGTGNGDLANAGLVAGTYAKGTASSVSEVQKNTGTAQTVSGGSTANVLANANDNATVISGGSLSNKSYASGGAATATTHHFNLSVTTAGGVVNTTLATIPSGTNVASAAALLDGFGGVDAFERIEFQITDFTGVTGGGGSFILGASGSAVAISIPDDGLTDYDTTTERLQYLTSQLNSTNFGANVAVSAELNFAKDAIDITIDNRSGANIQVVATTGATIAATGGAAGGAITVPVSTAGAISTVIVGNLAFTTSGAASEASITVDNSAGAGELFAGTSLTSTDYGTQVLSSTGTNEVTVSIDGTVANPTAAGGGTVAVGSTVNDLATQINTQFGSQGVNAWEQISLTIVDSTLESGDSLLFGNAGQAGGLEAGTNIAVGISDADGDGTVQLSEIVDSVNNTDFSSINADISASLDTSGNLVLDIRNHSGSELAVVTSNASEGRALELTSGAAGNRDIVGAVEQQLSGTLAYASDEGQSVAITIADPTVGGEFYSGNSNSSTFAGVNGLENGDAIINGVSIGASKSSSDTASAEYASDGTRILSSDKSLSGIAVAAAINDVSDETGVQAEVNATRVVGGDGSTLAGLDLSASGPFAVGDSAEIYINGYVAGTVTLQDDGAGSIDSDRAKADALNVINSVAGKTGVEATDNGVSLTLNAEDGRNISIAINDESGAAESIGSVFGLDSSVAGIGESTFGQAQAGTNRGISAESATYETTYSTVSLTSAGEFTIAAGSEGADELAALGLAEGSYGGAAQGQFLTDIDISTFEGATAALTSIDNALQSIAAQRADLGAIQNRMESTVSNLAITSENLAAANSRIQDADFAAETAELSRTQVLQQAGISILAQANQGPQQVLSLLG